MSETMIERVAKHLCAAHLGQPYSSSDVQRSWQGHIEDAGALLLDMRAPTEAMKLANPSEGQAVQPEDFWIAMIDAALAEGK